MVGAWLTLVLCIVAGVLVYVHLQAAQYDEAAIPYVRQVITEVSRWDPAVTRELMVAEVAAAIPQDKFERGMALFSRLGALQSMAEPEFEKVYPEEATVIGKQTIVEYNTEATYANDVATVNLKFMDRGGRFEIYRINFSSELLLE